MKLGKIIPSLVIGIVLFSCVLMIFPIGATSAQSSFSFHNQGTFTDESKILHVLGEVKNESETPLKDVIIKGSFYDEGGNLLDEFTRASELRTINPGSSSPFEILYIDSATVEQIANFTLSASGSPTENKEMMLSIAPTTSRLDVLGVYYINGLIENNGPETSTNTIVIATLYDSQGNVLAISKALAEASDRTSNMKSGSEVGFGIAVTDRLQTYKAKSLTLVADSDQYISNVFNSATPSQPANGTETQASPSGCLIATAAFGSEIAPQVQFLREFRDGMVMNTFAGSSFMSVFNSWYYSFSPSVADYERGNPWLRDSVKVSIYPLLSILSTSGHVYDQTSFNDEVGIVLAGVVASSLIGAVYVVPIAAGIRISAAKRIKIPYRWLRIVIVALWATTAVLAIAGGIGGNQVLMMAGSSMIVVFAIVTVTVAGIWLTDKAKKKISDRKP